MRCIFLFLLQNLWNLKKIDLEGCMHLTDIPDLSKATKLEHVNLDHCRKIESLNIHSKYLSKLYLGWCLSLTEISVTSGELTRLDLIVARKLESLNVHSTSFKELELSYCPYLKKMAMVLDEISRLRLLDCAIASLPSSVKSLPKLTHLDLCDCRDLVSLPELPRSLRSLLLDNCVSLVSLPELPSSLDLLSAVNCISLETEKCECQVLQHLLGPNLYGRDSKYFVFPGNHVIDECEFHTTEPSMSIPASCLNISHLCGFIYCIVFSQKFPPIHGRLIFPILDDHEASCTLDMSVSIYEDDSQLWHARSPPVRVPHKSFEFLRSDHMMFGYHDLSKFDGMSELHLHSRDVRIIFQLHEELKYRTRFGVFPVYATTSGFKLQISKSQSIRPKQPLHQ
ncbi:hypothetical protein Fmac_017557 [Flemingia macrophylla]|uniref:Disease resistance protein N-like protein n=1 Tax=Flemingia macrophylla TaxID=520843 RepID=A0ABD1M2L5_9FABA